MNGKQQDTKEMRKILKMPTVSYCIQRVKAKTQPSKQFNDTVPRSPQNITGKEGGEGGREGAVRSANLTG